MYPYMRVKSGYILYAHLFLTFSHFANNPFTHSHASSTTIYKAMRSNHDCGSHDLRPIRACLVRPVDLFVRSPLNVPDKSSGREIHDYVMN